MLVLGRLEAKLLKHTDHRIDKLVFLPHKDLGGHPYEVSSQTGTLSAGKLWQVSISSSKATAPGVLKGLSSMSTFQPERG